MITGYSQRRSAPRFRQAKARADRLADHVADGGSIAEFARAEQITETGARKIWRGIVAGLGEQAI